MKTSIYSKIIGRSTELIFLVAGVPFPGCFVRTGGSSTYDGRNLRTYLLFTVDLVSTSATSHNLLFFHWTSPTTVWHLPFVLGVARFSLSVGRYRT